MVILKSVMRNLVTPAATRTGERESVAGARARLQIELEKCVFCGLCQRRCPADALEVSRPEKRWVLRAERCILCGYCVDGCPTKCLAMDPDFRKPVTDSGRLRQVNQAQQQPAG